MNVHACSARRRQRETKGSRMEKRMGEEKRCERMRKATGIYGLLHFLVDFGCAFLVFRFWADAQKLSLYFFLYNFCAFALQMPVGLLADRRNRNGRCAAAGCLAVAFALVLAALGEGLSDSPDWAGAVAVVILAGLGNSLFHVGGGIEILNRSGRLCWPLGVFVSPGAAGIFFGTLSGKGEGMPVWLPGLLLLSGAFGLLLWQGRADESADSDKPAEGEEKHSAAGAETQGGEERLPAALYLTGALLCVFWVVVLRSHQGMIFRFPWKKELGGGMLALAGVVFGKAAGGIMADRFGTGRTAVCSLLAAFFCFFSADQALPGAAGLFFFNMSMPLTLRLAADLLSGSVGFAFGLLSFALFAGFLPAYLGYAPGALESLPVMLAALSGISLLILLPGFCLANRYLGERGHE